jgi:lipopolysaccharide transport system ATP-binding protein
VTFDVGAGESVGIIGRNGAGKSTLLKVLSRITDPTEGTAEIYGRVGSLLDVGTGFHPELTGRENIYLNGAILGMSRKDIGARFDDIVDFSEIGKFLDTPVKRYSSGMYVRLAFAVAAHLEPEILIVDEVLSVGDLAFQRKCVGKMEHVAGEGRTVLFVSHNMQAVRALCSRAIQIDGGRVVNDGDTDSVVAAYLEAGAAHESTMEWAEGEGPGDDDARLTAVRVLDEDRRPSHVVNSGQPIVVRLEFDLSRIDDAFCVGFDLAASDGSVVFRTYQTDVAPENWPTLRVGRNVIECVLPSFLLNQGMYFVMPRLSLHHIRWIVDGDAGTVAFEVHRDPGDSPYTVSGRPGAVAPYIPWRRVAEAGAAL